MQVVETTKTQADLFVVTKHYSKRQSFYLRSFGLVEDDKLQGIVVFGNPSLPLAKGAFKVRDFPLFELTRLVVQTKTKNAASYLISKALKSLPKPSAVVSYADTEKNHCGIVYQATNWLYTGQVTAHDNYYLIDGIKQHPRTIAKRGITNPVQWAKDNGITIVKAKSKHRYFYFLGSKKQTDDMLSNFNYQGFDKYPKCDQVRYDDGVILDITFSSPPKGL